MPTLATTYRVDGMTCEHCVRSVTAELSKLDHVTGVEVALSSGEVTLTSDVPLAVERVRAAVDEAGYELRV